MDLMQLVIFNALFFPVAYCVFHIFQFFRDIRRIGEAVDKLSGQPKHWLYGNLIQHPGINEAALHWFTSLATKYKTAVRFWLGPFKPTVVVLHPDTAKVILRTSEPKDDQMFGGYNNAVPWLGYGLLTSRGKQWARNRRLLTPAFHFDVLKPYVRVYNEAADTLIEKWQDALQAEKSVEIFSPVSLCTLNIILRCAFSYDQDVQRMGESHPYVSCVISLAHLLVNRNLNLINLFDFIYFKTKAGKDFLKKCHYAHSVSNDVIAKRKKKLELENDNKRKNRYLDFLDILLLSKDETGIGLTDTEIRQEVDTFLFEGHDTTASAISWALYNLACNPECQKKVQMELENLFADKDKSYLEWEDVADLPYLTQCVKESMRLIPPVPSVSRSTTKPLTIDGVTLNPGTTVTINIWGIHHNEHVWGPDHMDFKPERFEPDRMKNMDPFSFVSFSAGPRNCIGQQFAMHEVKIVVAKLLLAFNMEPDPNHITEMAPEAIIRARNGIKLFLTPR